jgi:hypothetical protein
MIEHEKRDVKYIHELGVYWDKYVYAVIDEIYVGIGINLGLSPEKAYSLARNNPNKLLKGIFKRIFSKLFKRDVPNFRLKKKIYNKGKPLSDSQWVDISKQISDYWMKLISPASEDIIIKAGMLGKQTTEYREKKIPYKRKSLLQVAEDQFGKKGMPATFEEAYKKYDFHDIEKESFNRVLSNVGMYVTKTDNNLQEAIRTQIQNGIDNNKSSIEVASDLYWQVEKGLVNQYTAEALKKDWHRISTTEMASIYEAQILASYEANAMRSLKDPKKAQYFVFTGGTCSWCVPNHGTITRLIPRSIIKDTSSDSLKAMGINDPNTDIAIWIGKNNIGFKRDGWRICTPAHPYNTATMQPIDLDKEYYDGTTDSIKRRQEKKQYVPQQKQRVISAKDEELKTPKQIDKNKVLMNDNIYQAYPANEINDQIDKWRENRKLPIPVQIGSPQYDRIFGEAK